MARAVVGRSGRPVGAALSGQASEKRQGPERRLTSQARRKRLVWRVALFSFTMGLGFAFVEAVRLDLQAIRSIFGG